MNSATGRGSLWQRLRPYIAIVRFDHWFKNVFMLPGMALAWLLVEVPASSILVAGSIALLSTGFMESANYVINEWLDANFLINSRDTFASERIPG